MEKSGFFRALRFAVVLVIACAVFGLLMIFRPQAERQVPSPVGLLVETAPAKTTTVTMIVEAFGTVRPRRIIKLAAEVRGQITELDERFEAGNSIAVGTRIVTIDPRPFELEVVRRKTLIEQIAAEIQALEQQSKNLSATLALHQTEVLLAEKEFKRMEVLAERKVIDPTTRDKAEQKLLSRRQQLLSVENQLALIPPKRRTLNAQHKNATVALQQAKLDLENTQILSSFDAKVLEKTVEKGQHVEVGTYLGSIYRENAFEVDVQIPADEMRWLSEMPKEEFQLGAEISYYSGASEYVWTGEVNRVLAKMDEKTRTLPLVVEIDGSATDEMSSNPIGLKPGMFVTVRLKGRKMQNIFVLPRHVLHQDNRVYLAVDGKLVIRSVTVLRRFKDEVYVSDGIADGDLLIETPLSDAIQGTPVRFHNGPKK